MALPAAVPIAFIVFVPDETAGLAAGALIAGLGAFFLPRLDRFAAVPVGLVATWLLLFVLPTGGPDSPLNLIAASCTAGFALGGLAGALAALAAGRRDRPR